MGDKCKDGTIVENWYLTRVIFRDLEREGKEVWMPTFDSEAHAVVFGATGTYGKDDFTIKGGGEVGISILKNGSLTEEMLEVVDIVREYNAIIGTSHLSKEEVSALVQHAKKVGGVKILITHPEYRVPNFDFKFLKTLVGNGIYAELCAINVFPTVTDKTVGDEVEMIRAAGIKNCIISSDAGAAVGPMPHDTLRIFAQLLFEAGISKDDLHTMMVKNPRKILDL